MPSASAKVEKVASLEAVDPIKQISVMLEKRMRNLEKKKLKLDNYRCEVKNGKELNRDQQIAVDKYDHVIGVLEFIGEFIKTLNTLSIEYARQQKKIAKKDQLERQQHEIQHLQEAFLFRHIVTCFQNEDVRNDFLAGSNGAMQITNEQLSQVDQLYKLLEPGLPSEKADHTNHFHVLSENHIFLVRGKNKEIVGTTYKVLKELLQQIKETGYFSHSPEPAEEAAEGDTPEENHEGGSPEKVIAESVQVACDQDEQQKPVEQPEVPEPCVANIAVETVPLAAQISLQSRPLQEVLSTQGSFNFLQESQIDLDAPHMDPAVVAVHQIAPPTANFAVNRYSSSTCTKDVPNSVANNADSCNMAVAPSTLATGAEAGIPPTAVPVLSSLRHGSQFEFDPSHPIQTQTFTNQSFAVMQKRVLPQAYVPAHHTPIPPHLAAAPPPPPAAIVPVQAVVSSTSENLQSKTPETDSIQKLDERESMLDAESHTNDKNGNNEGYGPPYHGGYHGRGRGRGYNNFFRGRSNFNNGRGGYQNHYYQDRNGYNNYRRGNNRGARGNNNFRARGNNNRTPSSQQPTQEQ